MANRQQLLGTVAPGRTTAAYRFERETLKRGGPLAVQGKRWTKKPKAAKIVLQDGRRGQSVTFIKEGRATAIVHGDEPMTPEGEAAMREIIRAATKMRMR